MNKAVLMGRLTKDPDVRTSQNGTQIARYTLAVDRRRKTDDQQADFISIKAFGKSAEFVEKYCKKGTKLIVTGRIETGSYEKNGQKVYTTDIIAEDQEFAESKNADGNRQESANNGNNQHAGNNVPSGFINIPNGSAEADPWGEELPFH